MKTVLRAAGLIAILTLLVELSGCGSPPPPPKSAQAEIKSAESAIEEADALMRRRQYELAKAEYERALSEIQKGLAFAGTTETARLNSLRTDAHEKKMDCETKARKQAVEAASKPKVAATAVAQASADPEVVKREEEKKQQEKRDAEKKAVLELANAPKTTKKPNEPEDAGEVSPEAAAKQKEKAEAEAAKPVRKDKQGIFPDVTQDSPPLEVVKLTRVGKFVVGYVQLYNKSAEGRRISVSNFFRDTDNKTPIDPRTAVSFPYDNFNLKAKDLIADQSLRNFTANSQEVRGHEFIQFVAVGEAQTEEAAAKINRLYVSIIFNDGSKIDTTGPANSVGGALDKALPKLLK